MSNEKKVKEKYLDAVSQKYKTSGFGSKTYYLIWDSFKTGNRNRLGEGDTLAQAWKDAVYWIKDNQDVK